MSWITEFKTEHFADKGIGQVYVVESSMSHDSYQLLCDLQSESAILSNVYIRFEKNYRKAATLYDAFSSKYQLNLPELVEHKVYGFSAGQSRLMAMFQSLSDVPKNGTFLIDDIEQSLHIEVQEKLIHFLLFVRPDIQIICTTFSPSIFLDGWADCYVRLNDIKL